MTYNMLLSGGYMEYLSVHEISKKWNMSERRITALCRNNRIIGVKKRGNSWLIPSDSIMPLDMRTKEYESVVRSYNDSILTNNVSNNETRVVEYFRKKYKKEPFTTFTPYRVCFLGADVDHNLGVTTGFAIDKGVHIAYSIKQNGIIELESLQFSKRAQWHILDTPKEKCNDWADHLRGAIISFNKRYPLRYGISAVIDGELPIGGLSSSSAIIITFINAVAFLNNISLSPNELIEIAYEAEKEYVGVSCGKLDQSCEVYARKNKLLFMDMKNQTFELIDTPNNMKEYVIGIFFSGKEGDTSSNIQNIRTDELRCAAYFLKAYSNIDYAELKTTNLRDVPYDVFLKYKDKLPDNFKKRAQHWYEECKRVQLGVELYKSGDIAKFGSLVTDSGYSTIKNWETISPELNKLYEILVKTNGVYGTRFQGTDFNGCCIALIDPKYTDEIINHVKEEYLEFYPNLKDRYSSYICHTADGVKL